RGLSFNLFETEEVALTSAGTRLLHRAPGGRSGEVGIPERPVPTLPRTRRIHPAAARLRIEKRAVVVRPDFSQAAATPDPTRVVAPHLFQRLAEVRRDLRQLLLIDPDVPFEPGAAIPALRALEPQPVFVPRLGAHPGNHRIAEPSLQREPRAGAGVRATALTP